ncbi:protein kinase [Corynebacterium poyangense]|uniref:non-specific serine/threonine protein kinase n=1 Tax=Corynebacterium poyangense TaxID=2684405 RepID=A0A7H0SMP3_9CORY|nr:protein kinase [Corynebacterium poyangense]QNQ89818.1 protein kinase [Corynebacterium poyangense]
MSDVSPFLRISQHLDDYEVDILLYLAPTVQVYLVWNTILDRYECLKLLTPQGHLSLDRMWAEARQVSRSGLPGVVPVYSSGFYHHSDSRSYPWFTMAYGEMGDLATFVRRMSDNGWSREEQLTVLWDLFRQVGHTLDELHHRSPPIIHGDIKPANIVVSGLGAGKYRALISDFGLDLRSGQTTSPRGTPHYMSPESFGPHSANPARDRYVFAVLVFEFLSGSRPFHLNKKLKNSSSPLAEYQRIQSSEVRPQFSRVCSLPGARNADNVFYRALSVDPERRYSSNAEFLDQLEKCLQLFRAVKTTANMVDGSRCRGSALRVNSFSLYQKSQNSLPEGSLSLPGDCPSTEVLSALNSEQNEFGTYNFAEFPAEESFPDDISVDEGCSLSINLENPGLNQEDGMLYIFNPPGSRDKAQVTQNKSEAQEKFLGKGSFIRGEYVLTPEVTLQITITQDYWDKANKRSTVCSIQDKANNVLILQVNRGATLEQLSGTGSGISSLQLRCGAGIVLLRNWQSS